MCGVNRAQMPDSAVLLKRLVSMGAIIIIARGNCRHSSMQRTVHAPAHVVKRVERVEAAALLAEALQPALDHHLRHDPGHMP